MKISPLFCLCALMLSSCTQTMYQEMQRERDTLREKYEDTRRKETFKRSRNFFAGALLGQWEFLELVIEEKNMSEDILKAKAARAASKLKGIRLRFWESGGTYHYRVENLIRNASGTYTTWSVSQRDDPQTGSLRLYPGSGLHISDMIFGFARGVHKQVLLGDREVLTTRIATKVMEISVKDMRIDLALDLGMVLTPKGWLRRGNIRCSFQKVE
ncbi:MAG: hypothetical protein OXG97_07255 [Candidatus Poribacteria bacterium]|nr:hypothetical protein [Candidatus Poribacteria bacterium]